LNLGSGINILETQHCGYHAYTNLNAYYSRFQTGGILTRSPSVLSFFATRG
jgi:hypothetical protein